MGKYETNQVELRPSSRSISNAAEGGRTEWSLMISSYLSEWPVGELVRAPRQAQSAVHIELVTFLLLPTARFFAPSEFCISVDRESWPSESSVCILPQGHSLESPF